MTACVLAIDPGAVSGLCVVTLARVPRLVTYGAHRLDRDPRPPVRVVGALTDEHEIVAAAVEDQYLARGPKANPQATIKVARIGGIWIGAFMGYGIPWTLIRPDEWQRAMLSPRRMKRAQVKRMAAMVASQRAGVTLTADAADAFCMACFHAERLFLDSERSRG